MDKRYSFFSRGNIDCTAVTDEYKGILTPYDLYEALSEIWCEYTCAPRLRDKWSKENITCGQCSVTAFLVQDIFGGRVYGVPLQEGNFHCYNVIGDCIIDLTSEQFGDEKLTYDFNHEQFREDHFSSEEKKARYELLKKKLEDVL